MRIVVAEHRALDLARLVLLSADAFFNHDLAVELCRFCDGRAEFLPIVRLRDSDRRPQVCGLYENGIFQLTLDPLLHFFRFALELAAQHGHVFHHGQSSRAEQRLHNVFIHARGRTEDAGANVGDVGQFEQTLNRPIFAEGSVQHGEDNIYVNGAIGCSTERGTIGLKGRQSSIVPRRFRKHYHRLARGQQRRSRSRLRIARAKLRRLCGTDTPFGSAQDRLIRMPFALQQSLGVFRREPAAVFRNADRDHFVFRFIHCVQNRRRRQQRHFMLAAASAKEDANP